MKPQGFQYSTHSLRQLATLHNELQLLCNTVIKYHDFKAQQGHRAQDEQDFACRTGTSTLCWPDSKHNSDPSIAVDLYPYVHGRFIGWDAIEQWRQFGGFVMGVAAMLYDEGKMTHHVRWGGDWDTDWDALEHNFVDMPHFELVAPEPDDD